MDLAEAGKINLLTDREVVGIGGDGKVENVTIRHKTEGDVVVPTDHFIPLFGLKPSLGRSEEHTSELQSRPHLVCRLLLEKKNIYKTSHSLADGQETVRLEIVIAVVAYDPADTITLDADPAVTLVIPFTIAVDLATATLLV